MVVDTVVRDAEKSATAFNHTDNNTFVNGIDGDANGALQTNNNSGSYLLVKDYSLGTGDFTISTWVKIDTNAAISGGNGTVIFANNKLDKTTGVYVTLRKNNSGYFTQVSYSGDNGDYNAKTKKVEFTQGAWHLFTLTRSGDTLSLYMDGTLVYSSKMAAGTSLGAQDLCFGAYINETWAYNNGNLVYDNVSIYDYALTEDQIKVLTANKM